MTNDGDDYDSDDRPFEREESQLPSSPKRKRDQPKIVNPYSEESSTLLPILVAVAACVPFLFCLCRL